MQQPTADPNKSDLRPWFVWLALFYGTWAVIVFGGGLWETVVSHWPIATAMAAGSYFAGATPMGGGTVGFPVLVLLFDQEAAMGRDFSFAVQSIGMTSASIFILATRQPLEKHMLKWALVGSLVGTPLGAAFIAPLAPELFTKLLFAVIWGSFGMMHLVKLKEVCSHEGVTPTDHAFDRRVGLTVGFFAGIFVASVTGVGIDMVIYAVLVLAVRADIKIAVPTSVVLMAFTSVVGIGSNALLGQLFPTHYSIHPEVFANWIAAAPVVALGAPLGAYVVNLVNRTFTLALVAVLCVAQFFWTLVHERHEMTFFDLVLAIVGIVAFNLAFREMHRWGNRLARREAQESPGAVAEVPSELALR